MPKRRRRDVEKRYSKKMFIATLRRVADALEQGRRVSIRVAGERVRVPAHATFSIEHERGRDEEELEFQLKWSCAPAPRRLSTRGPKSRGSAGR